MGRNQKCADVPLPERTAEQTRPRVIEKVQTHNE